MLYSTKNIDKINSLKEELDKLAPIGKEFANNLKKKFRLEFNYNSNHLEGNTLTYGQTQLLLLFDKSSGDVPVSDIEEMKAHDVALGQIEELAKDEERPLTEQFICELNKTILIKDFWKDSIDLNGNPSRKKIEIGKYKSLPNSVLLRNGEIHEYASPEETPLLMSDLIIWYRDNIGVIHPVHLAAEFHYKFVCIHPFDDGNGRVARLIMNYILLKNDYPPVIIKSDDKEGYLTVLQKADLGDKLGLVEYIEKQQVWSLELSIKAGKGEDIEEYGDIEKEIEILKRKKLTKSTIFRTPKVSYEIYVHINDDLWNPLEKFFLKFDDFFAESKTENQVNHSKVEKTKTERNFLSQFREREVVVKPYEVFGHDLEEEDVFRISWIKRFLSLKSASKKIDFDIDCSIKFGDSQYKLLIEGRRTISNSNQKESTILFEIENDYKTLFMTESVNDIVRVVSNYLIKNIQLND
ncbi:Fic family protein [Reichenbachiella sp. MALMAid0571]|uniref:Fic family protein n=1 Tax=Reichenbachiella sp. MALMAid0571 TaxID=3143939 RepID=UPI0032DE9026